MGTRNHDRATDTLTVADIMVTPVRTVPPDLPVAGLIRVLLSERITGAPVVDEAGAVVGVVSSSDVLRALTGEDEIAAGDTMLEMASGGDSGPPTDDPQETLLAYFEAPDSTQALLPLASGSGPVLGELTVADIMTPATFAIAPDATIRELAAFLTRGRIHRSLVVERGALRGIVTNSDIVRFIAGDAGEGSEP